MKVLIGTPVHQSEDKSIKKWLANVAKLSYPADLLMVDSSPGDGYVEKLKNYCNKYGIPNYKIIHFDYHQPNGIDERTGRSWEIIRQEVLSKGYDAWFSWKINLLIPADTLSKLSELMKNEDYDIIHQNFGVEKVPIEFIANFDCTLINRKRLEKFGFLLSYPNMPDCWHTGERVFKKKVIDSGGSYVEIYGNAGPFIAKGADKFKVLIGSAIHQKKDYSLKRWLENIKKLNYTADLLIVDNSPGLDYLKKIKKYCEKYKIKNFKLIHIEPPPEFNNDRRIEIAQEVIRQELLSHDYDAWFAWESDQLIPPDTLEKLISMMKNGSFMMVNHNCWVRGNPGKTCTDFGVSLVSRECFRKYSFIMEYGTEDKAPDFWEPGEVWIKKQVLKDGYSILEAEGVIGPIYHLEK